MSDQKIIENPKIGGIADNYNINKFFEDYVLQKEYFPYQFDGWKDKQFYGLVDKGNRAIYPKNTAMAYNSNDNSVSFKNLLFVVDAFQDMKKYHKNFITQNKFDINSSAYVSLDIKGAAKDLDSLFVDYHNKIFNIFLNTYLTPDRQLQIKDFISFVNVFLKFIKVVAQYSPFNRSSFIKSRICSSTISGLTIDFDEPPTFSDTKLKADKYISDPNFEPFLESAKRFGFFVDRNAPWRIVADLDSPALKNYYRRYNFENVDSVINNCYHVAYYSDIEVLKNVLVSFWNSYANNVGLSISQRETSGCSSLFAEITSFNQIDVATFEKVYSKNWLIRVYLFIKCFENGLSITQNAFEIIYREAIKLNEHVDENNMLDYIDRKMQELSSRGKSRTLNLTTPDEMIKMLGEQKQPSIAEGINF